MKIKYLFVLALLLVFSFVLSSCEFNLLGNSDKGNTVIDLEGQDIYVNRVTDSSEKNSIEDAVAQVYDSVVVINATSKSGASSGSGVLFGYSDDYSFIITCCHVVEGYSSYVVTLSNGSSYEAKLQGADPFTDLAVLYIKATDLTYANMIDDSNALRIGSDCFAIGNPLGTLGGTVTKGIVSATSRSIAMSDGSVHSLIQTDAAINSGNSGGGLFNNKGELIGIVSAKYSATGVEGLGFAIPANTVYSIVTDLIEKGYVEGNTSLGVTFSTKTFSSGSFFNPSYYQVAYASYIDPSGSAYGILDVYDIIISITVKYADTTKDNKVLEDISTSDQIDSFLTNCGLKIGDTVSFVVKHNSTNAQAVTKDVVLKQYVFQGE